MKFIFIVLMTFIPILSSAGQATSTYGPCSPIAPNNKGVFIINCPEITKQDARILRQILNKVVTERLDFEMVLQKLDEIQQGVNPNASRTTYTYEGHKRTLTAQGAAMIVGEAQEQFQKMETLARNEEWDELKKYAESQIRERPQWLTPYIRSGEAAVHLANWRLANQRLKFAEQKIADNTEYDSARPLLSELLRLSNQHDTFVSK
jgi:hypothetical protein